MFQILSYLFKLLYDTNLIAVVAFRTVHIETPAVLFLFQKV